MIEQLLNLAVISNLDIIWFILKTSELFFLIDFEQVLY